VAPRKIRGYRKPVLLGRERRVAKLLGQRPRFTYMELPLTLRADGIEVGRSAVWLFTRTIGWTHKKRFMPPRKSDHTS